MNLLKHLQIHYHYRVFIYNEKYNNIKMITNYDEYVNNKLNEGILSSLKNFFGMLLKNVSDDIKKPIDELTNKLNKAKDLKGVNTYLNEYLKTSNVALIKSIDESKNIVDLTTAVRENIISVYVSMDAANKSQGGNVYKFEDLFKDSSEELKKLFSKKENKFNKSVIEYSKNLVLVQGKPYGINNNNINSDESIEDKEITNAQTTDDAQVQEGTNESMLNEADASANGTITLEQFVNTKNILKKWFDEKLYKPIRIEMKESVNKKSTKSKSSATKNTDGVNKMKTALQELKGDDASIDKLADTISELTDPKQLATVRELLVKMGKGTKEDYGKF